MDMSDDDLGTSADAGSLAPREIDPAAPRRRSRRWGPIVLLGLIAVAGGVVVTKFLTSAIDYYCNVDEVGVKEGCDATRRLRIQGVVDQGTVDLTNGITSFTMSFNGASMPVRYDGDPGGLFQECIPVVVHGRLDDASQTFRGDRVEVKHSEEYEADNGERLASDIAASCS
jgi:cytochrome c-type biogenesis protein CcmE